MANRNSWRGIGLAAGILLAATAANAQPVFKTNIIAAPAMLDPITYSEIIAGRIMDKVYESLSANTAEGKIVPSLATEWKANDNATVWRFSLGKGVKFHSGREIGRAHV